MGTERVTCGKCHRKCSGQVLSVGDTYFHHHCFTCQKCGYELGEDAFYNRDGSYYCAKDYLDNYGEHCFKCREFLEGEVITALGNTFHLDCFTCGHCKKFFPPGETVVFDGQDYVCEECDYGVDPSSQQPMHKCAGCHKDIEHGQALMALDQHWHPQCFTCQKCGIVLHGEYMGKDGFAFCEKDYQAEFGVICAGCSGYITGKVLQAGDKHYHPQCSRCAKCGQMFGEGEEMYLQGSEIWHPQCSEEVRAEMEKREAESREMEEETIRREMDQREAERQVAERRDAERRDAEKRDSERREADMREAERREVERRDVERRDAERRDAEERDAERRDTERRDAERRDAERRDAERRDAEHRDVERREAERLEAERREMELRERDRREREIEGERREAERREMEQREIERRDRERREIEFRDSQRRDTGRRDAEGKREYYKVNAGQEIDVNVGRTTSPDFDDLPPPPRPEELPKGPPAPPTRTDSRAKDWKARYGSLPRSGSGSVNGDASEVPIRNGPSRPRPYSYHESSFNSYEETAQSTTVSSGGDQKYKTSVQLKIGKSTDDSTIGRSTTRTSSSSSAKSPEAKIYPYRELKVDNYRAPRDVDKQSLEKHLNDDDFRDVFRMTRKEFYELPKWKQVDQKKKAKLF